VIGPERDCRVRPQFAFAEFAIDTAPIWSPDDARLDPIFMAGPLWFDFAEFDQREPLPAQWPDEASLPAEVDAGPLDRERIDAVPDAAPPAPHQRASKGSLLGSLGVHLLPLLLLIGWTGEPGESRGSIPVQLVIEQQSPAPPSEREAGAAPPQAEQTAVAAATPPPPPAPLTPPVRPPRHIAAPPPPPRQRVAAPPVPKPSDLPPQPKQLAAVAVARREATEKVSRREAPRQPAPDGAMAREQYLAQLVALTWRHVDLLPSSFIRDRRGETLLAIRVLSDGTVADIGVVQSSGYPDIDARIEQMVTAIGRFPPLPPSLPGPSTELTMLLRFPQVLQR
jgi:TonB family protein